MQLFYKGVSDKNKSNIDLNGWSEALSIRHRNHGSISARGPNRQVDREVVGEGDQTALTYRPSHREIMSPQNSFRESHTQGLVSLEVRQPKTPKSWSIYRNGGGARISW